MPFRSNTTVCSSNTFVVITPGFASRTCCAARCRGLRTCSSAHSAMPPLYASDAEHFLQSYGCMRSNTDAISFAPGAAAVPQLGRAAHEAVTNRRVQMPAVPDAVRTLLMLKAGRNVYAKCTIRVAACMQWPRKVLRVLLL
jgi:hypothetical protein